MHGASRHVKAKQKIERSLWYSRPDTEQHQELPAAGVGAKKHPQNKISGASQKPDGKAGQPRQTLQSSDHKSC